MRCEKLAPVYCFGVDCVLAQRIMKRKSYTTHNLLAGKIQSMGSPLPNVQTLPHSTTLFNLINTFQ